MYSKTDFKQLPGIKRLGNLEEGVCWGADEANLIPRITAGQILSSYFLTVLFTKINGIFTIQSSCIKKLWVFSAPRLWSLITKKQGNGWGWVVRMLAQQFYVTALDSIYFSLTWKLIKLLVHYFSPSPLCYNDHSTNLWLYNLFKMSNNCRMPPLRILSLVHILLVVWKWECTVTMKLSEIGEIPFCNLVKRELRTS